MIQFYGTVTNMVNLAQLDNKWLKKKEDINQGNFTQMTAVERMVYQYEEQCREMREEDAKKVVYEKAMSGRELTPEEEAYLKKNNPTMYQDYLDAKAEKESYKRRLRECDTKEDVEKLKMNELGKFMAAAKKTASNPNIPKAQKVAIMQKLLKRLMNIEEEHAEFVKSAEYSELPEDMEEKELRKEGLTKEAAAHKKSDNIPGSYSESEDENTNEAGNVHIESDSSADNGKNINKDNKGKPDSGKTDKDFKESGAQIKAMINEVKSETKKIDMKV